MTTSSEWQVYKYILNIRPEWMEQLTLNNWEVWNYVDAVTLTNFHWQLCFEISLLMMIILLQSSLSKLIWVYDNIQYLNILR